MKHDLLRTKEIPFIRKYYDRKGLATTPKETYLGYYIHDMPADKDPDESQTDKQDFDRWRACETSNFRGPSNHEFNSNNQGVSMKGDFLPEPQKEALLKNIEAWNDKLALLRGDNIYDVSRLFFSSKGWHAHQYELVADIPYGSTVRENDRKVLEIVQKEILEPKGLQFIRTLMGRLICSDTEILGSFVNPSNSATQSKYDIIGTEKLATYFRDVFKEHIGNGQTAYLRRLTLSDKNITSTIETIPPVKDISDIMLFYPYMARSPEQIMKEFMASSSNVLLLIGPPGTGKSNFILQMMKARGWDDGIHLADREDVLLHPGLSDYIRNCQAGSVVITEDSDKLVMAREAGNENMSSLLNASAGIVSRDVKIIISTNLESISRVDEALMRPGRCFDILKFQKMTGEQGMAVREMMGLDFMEIGEEKVSLAEALKYHEIHRDRVAKKKSFGFVGA